MKFGRIYQSIIFIVIFALPLEAQFDYSSLCIDEFKSKSDSLMQLWHSGNFSTEILENLFILDSYCAHNVRPFLSRASKVIPLRDRELITSYYGKSERISLYSKRDLQLISSFRIEVLMDDIYLLWKSGARDLQIDDDGKLNVSHQKFNSLLSQAAYLSEFGLKEADDWLLTVFNKLMELAFKNKDPSFSFFIYNSCLPQISGICTRELAEELIFLAVKYSRDELALYTGHGDSSLTPSALFLQNILSDYVGGIRFMELNLMKERDLIIELKNIENWHQKDWVK